MDRINYLMVAFLREEITPAEQAELDAWLAEDPAHQALLADLQDPEKVRAAFAIQAQLDTTGVWQKVRAVADAMRPTGASASEEVPESEAIPATTPPIRSVPSLRRYWAAAAIIGLVGIGTWWVVHTPTAQPSVASKTEQDVPAPKTNRATLTLASGQTVYLDSVGNGVLAAQGNAQVKKQEGGQIAYVPQTTAGGTGNAILYNTLYNPRGSRVIALTLADGTKVWLNAESSIRYPVLFGADRTVELTGEAYLEVARDAAKPFYVEVAGRERVAVLGTRFNIRAYADEPAILTTLLDGSIRVGKKGASSTGTLLQPGEQAVLGSTLTVKKDVDPETVLAWKSGYFDFDQQDIESILREVARWYNVKVVYTGGPPAGHFSGIVSRSRDISAALHLLAQANIHYAITGNQITITNPTYSH